MNFDYEIEVLKEKLNNEKVILAGIKFEINKNAVRDRIFEFQEAINLLGQSVKLLAEGEISTNIYNDDYFIGNISSDKLTDILVGYAGKQVKIYIEVSK